jgi:hypothetical protein
LAHEWDVVLLSLCAALAFAGSSSLKHVSAGDAPDAQSLHLGKIGRFVWATLSHRLWLGGILCDVVGVVLQILALHLGALSVVQPLLVTGLVFALGLRQLHDQHRVTKRQIGWATTLTVALVGFLLVSGIRTGPSGPAQADRLPALVAAVVGSVLVVACIELGRRQRSEEHSAALLGVAVGVIYAADAAVLKAISDILVRNPLDLIDSWQLYVVVALGASGLLLNQLAFQAGPITASLPAAASVDPLLSIIIGVLVYDERIRSGFWPIVALIVLLLLLGVAVIQLTRTAVPD